MQISFRNKDLREWNPGRSDHHVLLMTSPGIPLSQIIVPKVICIEKSVHDDVVGILVTSESSWSVSVCLPPRLPQAS